MNNLCLAYVALLLQLTVASHQPVPMLIVKSGTSGSSWFTAQLNRRSGVFIKEELFPQASKVLLRVKRANYRFTNNIHKNLTTLFGGSTKYLAKALRNPMTTFPKGAATGFNDNLVLVGATHSPMAAFYVSLVDLPRMVPDLRLVLYVRTNIVKHAISSIRNLLLKEKCNKHVVNGNCSLTGKMLVNVSEFDELMIRDLSGDQMNLDQVRAIAPSLERYFFRISYEEVMGDLSHIDRLLLWAGINPDNSSWMPSASAGKCRNNCTKNTSDDLHEVVENYEEVESWIESNYPCLLNQFHETRPDVMQPDVHILCGDLFAARVDMFNAEIARATQYEIDNIP